MSKPCATCKDCISKEHITHYGKKKYLYNCLYWSDCVKLARYEKRLEKNRRFYKGSRMITDPKEILENKWVWAFSRLFHTQALGNMRFKDVMHFLSEGRVYEAIDKNAIIKENDNADDRK